MARTPEPCLVSKTFLLTRTGAAWNLFVVKTAAPAHGVSDAIKARSGKRVFDALTPTWVPDTLKPFGYVPDMGMYFCLEAGIDASSGAE